LVIPHIEDYSGGDDHSRNLTYVYESEREKIMIASIRAFELNQERRSRASWYPSSQDSGGGGIGIVLKLSTLKIVGMTKSKMTTEIMSSRFLPLRVPRVTSMMRKDRNKTVSIRRGNK
jgi:hypothetical protein